MLLLATAFAVLLAGASARGSGESPNERLNVYAEENNVKGMKKAIKDGADINSQGSGRRTPIMAATLAGATDAVMLMLGLEGVDVSIPEKDGYTPMHGAAFQGRYEIAKVLMAAGLDPSDKHSDGWTPIHRACWGKDSRHYETVRAFVEGGVSPNEICNGATPLDSAKSSGNRLTVDYLKKVGGFSAEDRLSAMNIKFKLPEKDQEKVAEPKIEL